MPPLDVNWIAVLVAAVAYFILGAFWYGPIFGGPWVAGMDLDPDTMEAAPVNYVTTFVAELGICLALAALLAVGDVTTITGGIMAAFWLWLGLVATTMTVNTVWDPRPVVVAGVNAGYHLAAMILAAVILAGWPG